MREVFWKRHSGAKATLACMNDYKPLWEHNEHIAETEAAIKLLTTDIWTAAQKQGDNQTPGHTADKNDSMDAMLGESFAICKKMRVFARKVKNQPLQADTDYTESSFDEGTEEEQIDRCERIARLATEHLDGLIRYEVSAGDIASLNARIEAVKPKEAQRDNVGARRTQATASISTMMTQLSEKQKELDEEMDAFMTKPEHQEFHETYSITRRTRTYHGKGKKVETAA
ncbi:MAG: hypothetical protein EOO16_21370 [Chitinophagaceae bacterium]|nr:MAG: hypothetical protein EOO16_21370 [Chitinophagaceae bacterium]